MTRRQATDNTAQERVDAAVVDAYERRIAGLRATAEDDALEAEIAAAELSAYASLHQRVAALPQGEVASGVRAVVLAAAVQAAEEHAAAQRSDSPLARLLIWIMRPGPLLGAVTAVAILVAISVRQEPAQSASAKPDSAVAMAEPPTLALAPAPEPAAPAPAAAAPAAVAPTDPAPAAVPAAPVAPPAEAPAAPAMPRPLHTIAAQAASLGPVDAPAAKAEVAPEPVKAPAVIADNEKRAERKPVGKAASAYDEQLDDKFVANGDSLSKREMAKNITDSLREETQNQRPSGGAADRPQAQANAAPAPPAEQAQAANTYKDVGTRNQVAEKANADLLARWRQTVEDAQTPDERIAALKQLVAAAQAAGDDKTAKLARQALKAAEAALVARKRAESLQETPPSQRAKAAPSQGSGELKAQKPKN